MPTYLSHSRCLRVFSVLHKIPIGRIRWAESISVSGLLTLLYRTPDAPDESVYSAFMLEFPHYRQFLENCRTQSQYMHLYSAWKSVCASRVPDSAPCPPSGFVRYNGWHVDVDAFAKYSAERSAHHVRLSRAFAVCWVADAMLGFVEVSSDNLQIVAPAVLARADAIASGRVSLGAFLYKPVCPLSPAFCARDPVEYEYAPATSELCVMDQLTEISFTDLREMPTSLFVSILRIAQHRFAVDDPITALSAASLVDGKDFRIFNPEEWSLVLLVANAESWKNPPLAFPNLVLLGYASIHRMKTTIEVAYLAADDRFKVEGVGTRLMEYVCRMTPQYVYVDPLPDAVGFFLKFCTRREIPITRLDAKSLIEMYGLSRRLRFNKLCDEMILLPILMKMRSRKRVREEGVTLLKVKYRKIR